MHRFYYEYQAILSANLCYVINADQILSLHFLAWWSWFCGFTLMIIISGSKKIYFGFLVKSMDKDNELDNSQNMHILSGDGMGTALVVDVLSLKGQCHEIFCFWFFS
jgi:hypothetical protein